MNVTLQGKRDFADVVQLKILRWGIILDCPGKHSLITRVLTQEAGGSGSGKVVAEAEVGVVRGHEPRSEGSLEKPEKARDAFSPGTCRRNTALPIP